MLVSGKIRKLSFTSLLEPPCFCNVGHKPGREGVECLAPLDGTGGNDSKGCGMLSKTEIPMPAWHLLTQNMVILV